MAYRRCLGCGWDYPPDLLDGVLCEPCRLSHLAGARQFWGVASAGPASSPTLEQAQRAEQQMWWRYSQADNIS